MNALKEARMQSRHSREMMVKRRNAEVERVFQNVTQGRLGGPTYPDSLMGGLDAFVHNRGEFYAAIRPVAQRIAGQPIMLGRVITPKMKEKGYKPRYGRRLLSVEEKARLPKYVRVKAKLPLCESVPERMKMMKTYAAESADIEIIDHHPILEALSDPNPRFIQHDLIECTVTALEVRGEGYWWLTRSTRRKGFDIWYVPPHWVQEEPQNATLDAGWLLGPPGMEAEPIKVKKDRMIYFYIPDAANPFQPYPTLRAAMDSVRCDESILSSQVAGFGNGMRPDLAFITGDVIDTNGKNLGKAQLERWQINEMLARIGQEHRGPRNSRKPIFLDRLISDAKIISMKPNEMDWAESGDQNVRRVWRTVGTPRVMSGDVEDANKATATVADGVFCKYKVNPRSNKIGQVMNDNLLPHYMSPEDDGELVLWIEESVPEDEESRRAEIELLADRRGITVDEMRAEVGKPPLENDMGKVLISSGTMVIEPADGSLEQSRHDAAQAENEGVVSGEERAQEQHDAGMEQGADLHEQGQEAHDAGMQQQQEAHDSQMANEENERKKPPKPKKSAGQMRTLYVSRDLLNADDVIAWFRDQGFPTTMPPGELHVTVIYSKERVDWARLVPDLSNLIVANDHREVKPLGDKGAVVLRFESQQLQNRWADVISNGAKTDFPGYQPHVTISYNAGGVDLQHVSPYAGPLIFGPEIFKEVNDNWQAKIGNEKQANQPRTAQGLPGAGQYGTHAGAAGAGPGPEPVATRPHCPMCGSDEVWKTEMGWACEPCGHQFGTKEVGPTATFFNGQKHNPNHDAIGRFSSGRGSGGLGELKADWSKAQPGVQKTVSEYMNEDGYSDINGALRSGDWMNGPEKERIQLMDDAFAQVGRRTTQEITVYRGVENKSAFGESISFMDRGFVSTSASREEAGKFAMGEKSAVAAIKIPAGKPVLVPYGSGGEQEVILPRNSRFKISRTPGPNGEIQMELR